jgi:hypothetical protein
VVHATEFDALGLGISNVDTILDYTDVDGTFTAFLAPNHVPAGIDYYASTFGVSMECQAVRNSSCITDTNSVDSRMYKLANFNCSDDGLDLRLSGALFPNAEQVYELDLHRLFQGPPPFTAYDPPWRITHSMINAAANLSDADASDIFRNPWRLLSVSNVNYDNLYNNIASDDRIYRFESPSYYAMIACNATGKYRNQRATGSTLYLLFPVWNVDYTFVDSRVNIISQELSNSTVAGIASMTMADMFHFGLTIRENVLSEANYLATNVDEFVKFFTRGMARAYVVPLGPQSSPRPALLVQSRNSRIVSQVPKAALWLLVTANLLYIILAISLTVLALVVTSMDVQQLQTRLNVTGLAAQLFEGAYAGRQVRDEKELFEASARVDGGVKRVGVQRTRTGGTTFEVVES